MDEHTIESLHRGWRAGPHSFLRILGLMAKSRWYGVTFLVFEMRAQDCPSLPAGTEDSLILRPYMTWELVPPDVKATLARDLQGQYWGRPQWMQLGWRMWVGTLEGALAVISWTRETGQCEDFLFPISADEAVIWQTITVPGFRGRGLCPLVFQRLASTLFGSGFARIYICCRDYNTPSVRAITKAGFRYIGRGMVKRRTGQGIWYPAVRPFTQG